MIYKPNEVIFREGIHNHEGDTVSGETSSTFELNTFFASNGTCPDKNEHALYYIDTVVLNSGDGKSFSSDNLAKNQKIVVLYKGDKPVSVDYRYVANAPKITIDTENYGLKFDSLFSVYRRLD